MIVLALFLAAPAQSATHLRDIHDNLAPPGCDSFSSEEHTVNADYVRIPFSAKRDLILPRMQYDYSVLPVVNGLREVLSRSDSRSAIQAGLPPIPIYPLAGILERDININNYVDIDSNVGTLLDFHCSQATYDGHDAHDVDLLSFEHEALGVPVFSAQDGTVVFAEDSNPDGGSLANGVVVDHGGGWSTFYFHLRQSSVNVSPGESVHAGQQIGLAGSSGACCPHLHFAVYKDGQPVEPNGGPCNPSPSLWTQQSPFPPSRVPVRDCGFSRQDLAPWYPWTSSPREGSIEMGDPGFFFWYALGYVPSFSTVHLEFIRPNGTLSAATSPYQVGNTDPIRESWGYAYWVIPEMQSIPGRWTVKLYFNGELSAEAPLEVVQSIPLGYNAAPNPVNVEFTTIAPTAMDPIVCRVTSDHLYDDPDYDIVVYRYQWKINGITVRDITSASLSDILERGIAEYGDLVQCTVIPSDGALAGTQDSVEATIGSGLTYPGGQEDLRLLVGVDGAPEQLPEIKPARMGSRLWAHIESPQGTLVGGVAILRIDIFRGQTPMPAPSAIPGQYLNPNTSTVLFDGRSSNPPSSSQHYIRDLLRQDALLAPGGLDLLFHVPPVVKGFSVLLQATVIHENAANGQYAVSNGQALSF